MAIAAVARETPISSSWDIPDPDLVLSAGRWTPAGLREAIEQLCARYDLPAPEDLGWEDLGDPELAAFQVSAPRLYLASVAACALGTTSAYPVIGFGAWSATDLAAHLGVSVPPRTIERDLFTEPQEPRGGSAVDSRHSTPVVLVGEVPAPGRLEAVIWNPLLANPRIEVRAEDVAVLRAGVHLPSLSDGIHRHTEIPDEHFPTEYEVEIRESLLLRALGCALDLVERATSARLLIGEPLEAVFARRAVPGPEWMALVPELPAWARTAGAFGPTASETVSLWEGFVPVPPSTPAKSALQARAFLAHQLFSLASFSPELGWAALLSGARDSVTAIAAARAAGVRILPPSVQSAADTWENVDASVPTVRAPLRLLENLTSTSEEIARSFRVAGSFASVPDLLSRVPVLVSASDTLRLLLEVGALDSLCDRAVLSANWNAVSEWCRHAPDSEAPEPVVAGVPLFSVPSARPPADWEPDDWWEHLFSDTVSSLAPGVASLAPQEAAVTLKESVPPDSRLWRNAGEDLLVLTLRTDHRTVHAVIAPSEQGRINPRSISIRTAASEQPGASAVWIDASLVSATVGRIEVLVPLLGDRDRDLERLRRVQGILGQHPGELPVRLALIHGESKRNLPQSDENKVAWSGALVDDLEVLLGPNAVRLHTGI